MSDFLGRIQSLSPKRLALLAYELNEQLESLQQAQNEPIAIIGMGCRFPGGVVDPNSYWQLLASGRDPLVEVPRDRWDVEDFYDPDPSVAGKTYTRRGGFIDDVDRFDPEFFNISPREALAMDPQQRLLLEVGWEALERAGYAPEALEGSTTGVYVAIGIGDYANLQARSHRLEDIDAYTGSGNGFCFTAGRLSYVLGLQGPSFALDAACSSSLIALHLACQSLRARECAQALVGGVNLILSPDSNLTFSATNILSAQGRCRSFDADADGFVRAEGCAVLMLKRLSDAQRDRDNIIALVKGTATNHCGAGAGLTVPSGAAQQTVARQALEQAGVKPADVQYVEAHGTGTPLGDPIEVTALGQVYKQDRDPQNPLFLASVKTNIGHTEVVSGLASLVKVMLAMQHQALPAHLHFQTLNPEIDLDDIPAKIPTQLTPWPGTAGSRLAAVNSFGMSGTNAHAILAEAPLIPDLATPERDRPLHLLPLTAKTPRALWELLQRYDRYLANHPEVDLGNLCFTAALGRAHFQHRWSAVAASVTELRAAIASYFQATPEPEATPVEIAAEALPVRLAPIFVASVPSADLWNRLWDLGAQLGRTQPAFQSTIARCRDCPGNLPPIEFGPNERPSPVARFALQVALVELWRSWGIEPAGILVLPGSELLAAWMAGAVPLDRALQWAARDSHPRVTDLQSTAIPLYCSQTGQPLEPQTLFTRSADRATSDGIQLPQDLENPVFLVASDAMPTGMAPNECWLASAALGQSVWQTLLGSLSALYEQGAKVDWSGFDRDYSRQRLPLPTYPFQRQRYWSVAAGQGAQLQPAAATSVSAKAPFALPDLQPLTELAPEERSPHLAAYLTARLALALGVEGGRITPETPLQALALDSIVALELKFDLEKVLGSSVELAAFLASPTIAALADGIVVGLEDSTPVDLPELKPDVDNRHQPFPLNEIQQAYWLGRSASFELGNVAAHVFAEYLSPGLDCARLQAAFQHTIARHDALRTVVLPTGQQQVLTEVPIYEIQVLDLSELPAAEREQQLQEHRDRLSHEVRNPEVWPLFDVLVVRLEPTDLRVLMSVDNLLVDGSSLQLLCQEWGQFYQDLDAVLPSLEVTFRDYVLSLEELEDSALQARSRDYWQERLDALPAGPDLPLAVAPASVTQPHFQRLTGRLPAATWKPLQQQANKQGLTPSGLLLAAFAEVLAAWSKQRQFCLNLTTFNRLPLHPQVRDLVGDFTNLALLAIDYRDTAGFGDRARAVQQQLWQDLEHSYVSGLRVMRDMAHQGDRPQMMPVVFTSLLATAPNQAETGFGTDWLGKLVTGVAQTPQVWLDHQVYEEDGDLVYNWDVVAELFPEGLVADMFAAYRQLLEALAANTNADINPWQQTRPLHLPLWQQTLQQEYNQTTAPIPSGLLHADLAVGSAKHPERPAVIAPDRTLTYSELYRESNRVAQHLQVSGVEPGQLVAISLPKGWEQVVAAYGILAAGGVYVPLAPDLPGDRRADVLEQSGTTWVLTLQALQEELTWPDFAQVVALDNPALQQASDAPLSVSRQPGDLAYIIYTSGSTGRPKGVAIDHRGAVNTFADINQRFNVGEADRVFSLSSLSFDLSVYDIFGAIAAGSTLVMPPADAARDPATWLQLIAAHGVTVWNSVPALMQMLVTQIGDREVPELGSLRLVMMSGDWIPLSLPSQIRRLWPGAEVVSLGGATEASIWSIFYPIGEIDPAWKSVPYGRPLTNQSFYVLDAQLEPCPAWVPGELFIGGIGLAQCYWQDPEKTAASFITHPTTGDRLYRTGDLGRHLPSGEIEFLGREDNQVQLRGYRIELGDIESTLERHLEVGRAATLVVGEGEGNRYLGALVTPTQSTVEATVETTVFPWESLDSAASLWEQLVAAGLESARTRTQPQDLTEFHAFATHLQALYRQGAGVALHKLGVFPNDGQALNVEQLRQRGQILPRYQQWLQRACEQLAEEGWCVREGQRFAARSLPTAIEPEAIERVRAGAAAAMDLSPASTDLLLRTVENLADLLAERQHSAEIYTAQEIPEVYEKQFVGCNELIADALVHWVQMRAGEPLHILEVGAGIGSTTRHILPRLPAEGIRYCFTDISAYFLQRARKEFEAYSFLEHRLLNLEVAPEAQGYTCHAYDAIVASSVLHATRDIAETLTHLRRLLRPGGILLILEETQFHPPFDLTMGLQQGFDRAIDLSLRPKHPLLSRQQWTEALQTHGFSKVQLLPQTGTFADWLGFDVLMAQGPTTVRGFQAKPLQDFLAQHLPSYMVPPRFLPLEAMPLSGNGKVDRQALAALWPKTETAREIVAPRNPLEEAILAIWIEAMGVTELGVEDNFFELGGDSLVATQVMARVRETFGVEVSLQALFAEPTVAALALAVAQALAEQIDGDLLDELETEGGEQT
ncbi:amino acid adenylation domain protein [Rubidibacter lacunae KORDI 51-2]|uniref:Phenyloxazoline synthase MbtB n=1 Tax=Rubidibacter lacunae KORDI 51-2 TaxID=582515 RepID=U5DNC3_9CHRO|nr:non-ribosomal peptide synthetase [Rubidibacter lacunae]ERN42089.1 amino acid adenylation domain protein [Rubidibacter lacunae KORDI 51-2]